MSGIPRLPDLTKLTEAQKDELILSLWQTVLALEGGGEQCLLLEASAQRGGRSFGRALAEAPHHAGRGTPRRGHRFLESRLLLGVLLVIGAGVLAFRHRLVSAAFTRGAQSCGSGAGECCVQRARCGAAARLR